ncbi:hypothetical protein ACR78H_01005 [Sphingobacterium siyangense]|uniref:hypothetical protein n=1 Tax=Sphingobacterium siyangense TaxID=459529 RepID=UPI002FDB9289
MSVILEKGQTIGFYKAIIPIIVSVFGVYLTIGIALGLLPKFVEGKLGYDSFIVGLVIGLQSLATLLTRAYSGKITDTKGAKKSKMSGAILAVLAGSAYVLAFFFNLAAVQRLHCFFWPGSCMVLQKAFWSREHLLGGSGWLDRRSPER